MVFSEWNPTYPLLYNSHVYNIVEYGEPSFEKEGYYDTVVRTGTYTSRTSGQAVIYSHVSLFSRIHRYCSLLCSVMLECIS